MKAREAAGRMQALERHGREFTVEQYLAWLLGLDDEDVDDAGRVMLREVRRSRTLALGHYRRVTERVAVGSTDIDVVVAFMQGATFAAAALGWQPRDHERDRARG